MQRSQGARGGGEAGGGEIGRYLRGLRTARKVSLELLAAKAAVARSTLNRWELGTHQPYLPALEAVLAALEVTPAEREQAITLIRAPRAVRHLRAEAEARAAALGGEWVYSAGNGGSDLLGAMRCRRGLSQEQVAGLLGVPRHTLSRWERGESMPPRERLGRLLAVLGARPEERAALVEGRLLPAPCPEAVSLNDLEAELHGLTGSPFPFDPATEALKDLAYLRLEAHLAGIALRRADSAARYLLRETWAWHAHWLSNGERHREAAGYAQRVLEAAREEAIPAPSRLRAAIVSARSAVYGGRRVTPARGVELLRRWVLPVGRPEFEAWILRDMADYLSQEGQTGHGLELAARACAVARRCENPTELRLRNFDRAQLLVRAGRASEALPLLPLDEADHPRQRAVEALTWAETLLAVGDRAEAQDRLSRAYVILRGYDLGTEAADALSRRF